MSNLNIQLLLTGTELMKGDIIDSNSAMIAQQLADIGLTIYRKTTVGDEFELLVSEIKAISEHADILIINGGLGPTVDDLTAEALAKAANSYTSEHPGAIAHLENWCEMRGFELNEPNRKQAMLPNHCDLVENPVGSAIGFSLTVNKCLVICTPGVPRELKAMLKKPILALLTERLPKTQLSDTSKLQVFGIGESTLQKMLNDNFPDWPQEIELGFRAAMPLLEVKLTSHRKNTLALKQQWLSKITELLGNHIIGPDNAKIPNTLIELLSKNNAQITTAESCTGGLISSTLTSAPGASQVFEAGYVTYSNRIKHELLQVKQETLATNGAVSQPVVEEMLLGALSNSKADYGIAVSGIAGPDGGTQEKPVGTVWIAWGTQKQYFTECLYIPGGRYYFQQYVTYIGLDLIRRLLMNCQELPLYIQTRRKN